MIELGSCYEEGKLVELDYKKAFELYKKAADLGSVDACNYTGLFYQDGIGCEKNFEKAFYYFNEALKDDNRSAYNNLAYLYLNGLGTEKDYEKSLEYFTKINFRDNYILDILDKITRGSKIIEIEKLLELRDYSLNDDDIVIISKKNNINYHDYYDYKKLKK